MKIAQIIPSLVPTGPVSVALDLAQLFQEAGHQVGVYYFDEKPQAIPFAGAIHIPTYGKIDWQEFDVVHSHGIRPDYYVWRYARRMPLKISTLHNYVKSDLRYTYGPVISAIFSPIWSFLCSRHDANVVLSEDMLNYYRPFWQNQHLFKIPNTRKVSLEKNPEREKMVKEFAGNRKVIGSVSNVTGIKGLEQLVEFVASNEEWTYVHVGGGDWKKLQVLAQELDVAAQCLFLGHQPKGWQYARAFDIFALPSRSEGFPLSLIEAVQLEVPIITSDIGVFRELFPSQAIARFQLDDIDSMSKAIFETRLDPQERTQKALQHFNQHYHPKKVAQEYIKLYKSLL